MIYGKTIWKTKIYKINDEVLVNANKYLEHWDKEKKLNWFDMSHLLCYLFPEYTKEELLQRHIELFGKGV